MKFLKTVEISGGNVLSDDGHYLLIHLYDDDSCVVEIYEEDKGWVNSDRLDGIDGLVKWIAFRDVPENLCDFIEEELRDMFRGDE